MIIKEGYAEGGHKTAHTQKKKRKSSEVDGSKTIRTNKQRLNFYTSRISSFCFSSFPLACSSFYEVCVKVCMGFLFGLHCAVLFNLCNAALLPSIFFLCLSRRNPVLFFFFLLLFLYPRRPC